MKMSWVPTKSTDEPVSMSHSTGTNHSGSETANAVASHFRTDFSDAGFPHCHRRLKFADADLFGQQLGTFQRSSCGLTNVRFPCVVLLLVPGHMVRVSSHLFPDDDFRDFGFVAESDMFNHGRHGQLHIRQQTRSSRATFLFALIPVVVGWRTTT